MMLSQMVNINRASRAAHLLFKAQKRLAQVNRAGPNADKKIRGYLQIDKISVKELVQVYRQLANQTSQSSMFSLTEEKILNLLTEASPEDDEDDIVSQYLPRNVYMYDYTSLCQLFIEIASVGRRPTPLIKAASNCLTQLPSTESLETESQPKISTLISTLNALVRLSYISRPLINKIVSDITSIIDMKELDSSAQCILLRSLGGLKWRHEPLMKLFYEHVSAHQSDPKVVTPNLLTTLLYVTAHLNYEPPVGIREFYNAHMLGALEDSLDRRSRKWLNYVWSLALLDVADEHHLRSVLNDEYIQGIQNPLGLQRFNHADVMKLLNLRGIAKIEKRIDASSLKLDELGQQRIQRSSDLEKFASRMKLVLNSFVKSDVELRHGIHTPYGFVVDCEALLNKDNEFIPLECNTTLEDELSLAETLRRPCDRDDKKCAIIYLLFDEAIVNHQHEPVGHRKIMARILRNAGYRTVFLQECLLDKEKTSADLANKIRETITAALKDDSI